MSEVKRKGGVRSFLTKIWRTVFPRKTRMRLKIGSDFMVDLRGYSVEEVIEYLRLHRKEMLMALGYYDHLPSGQKSVGMWSDASGVSEESGEVKEEKKNNLGDLDLEKLAAKGNKLARLLLGYEDWYVDKKLPDAEHVEDIVPHDENHKVDYVEDEEKQKEGKKTCAKKNGLGLHPN